MKGLLEQFGLETSPGGELTLTLPRFRGSLSTGIETELPDTDSTPVCPAKPASSSCIQEKMPPQALQGPTIG